MKVQIILFSKEAGWSTHETTLESLIETATDLGYEHTGQSERHSPLTREVLIGKPTFKGLYGPMYNGEDCPLRYEAKEAYERLSA